MCKIKIFLTFAVFILSMFAAQAQTPGGVNNPNYSWAAWLTPDSYSAGTWTNYIAGSTIGNFTAPVTPPQKLSTGRNFHPSVRFISTGNDAPNVLLSQNNYVINSGDNVTFIVVMERSASNRGADGLFTFVGNGQDRNIWFTGSSTQLRWDWPTTDRNFNFESGMLVLSNANAAGTIASNGIMQYVDGTYTAATATTATTANSRLGIGATQLRSYYGFDGTIQELILLRATGGAGGANHMAAVDLQKIHSYLAVKYGFSLTADDYLNSDGYAVWNRTTNTGYNNNIFGIGRDNATRLNQVQSVSQNNNMLTVYKGTFGTNNNNGSTALTDKTFLMLGSNALTGNTSYEYPAATAFANGSITDRINYRSAAVYKAQITTAGTGGGQQIVNVNVISTTARYVIVSANAAFPIGSTRIYPLSGLTATDVEINDGEYITTAGFQSTPGGSKSVTFGMWLTPDSYNTGVWTNLIGGAIGDFVQPANWSSKSAPNATAGTNFHPAVQFRPGGYGAAVNRLQSQNGINLTANDAFTFLVVYKATNAGYDYQNLLNFQGSTGGGASYNGTAYALSYRSNNSPVLSMGWPTTARALGSVPFGTTALVTVDNNNTGASGIRHYLNGTQIATATSASGAVNNRIMLGSAWYDANGNGERGVNADIQEVIMLQRPKATVPFLSDVNAGDDLKKIHSYLAIKYGISMNASDYMATDGTVVWDNAANTGYNNFIFGIGRDDETGLYQKQSVSAANNQMTIFLGNKLETYNSQNTATLNDREHLILGSNGKTTVSLVNIANGTEYANGNINANTGLNFQSDIIYKAQLTNLTEKTVNVQLRTDYLYVLVSKDDTFDPLQTNIYPVNSSKIATIDIDTEYKYIRFVGYSAGPGGVNINLRLWLRGDDEGSLVLENLPLTDTKLSGYPYPVTDNEAIAVQSWTDQLRAQTYSWAAGPSAAVHRIPVYEPNNLMMNFKPSVRFWGSGNSYGSYLSNPSGILATARPNNDQHTAYFVTSNNFSTGNNWIYAMMFGSTNLGNYNGPGYGMQLGTGAYAGRIIGRFRTNSWEGQGENNLFSIGATSISGYYHSGTNITFRFNGKEDPARNNPLSWGNFNMSAPSMLGPGYDEDRTLIGVMGEVIIFEHILTPEEQQKVESYLAIKYGTTLRPSNTATNRFDYILSNERVFWRGDVPTSDPVFGKYANYYNNVAAVIRDNAGWLRNDQSHSTDAGSILHMGVAGTRLGSNYDVSELNDLEVISWGSDTGEGVTNVPVAPCAVFETIFNRKWLVHKQSEDDRPLTMLVGAEDNSQNNLGSSVSAGVMTMYSALASGNDVFLIVADAPEKLTPGDPAYGDFKAVVPMRYIDGEQQCIYTFNDSIVYVTFGYKPNTRGCYSDIQFEGSKTYNWNTQWTRQNYNLNGVGARTIAKPEFDLDEGVTVTTQVAYDNAVRSPANYPRFSTNPRNGLEIRRRYGTAGVSKVTTTITFSTPVVPQFFISGLDSRSRRNDQITITGTCPGGAAMPTLMYASDEKNSTYTIQGNRATANKNRSASATNKNGILNVSFQGGVTTLVIEYVIDSNRAIGSATQSIFISPISVTNVLPPPTFNEDGLSFTKQVASRSITTCEPMEYTFRVGNINNDSKYLDFTDILPDKMTWLAESVSLDTINAANTSLKFNAYGGTNTLKIDSLLVPCASDVIFKATAVMDEDAPTATYSNRASAAYERIIENVPTNQVLQSQDAETLAPTTDFNAAWAERQDTVKLEVSAAPPQYTANREILVTLKVNNPNATYMTDMFLDVTWDAGFTYVAGSWNEADGTMVDTGSSDDTSMSIIGMLDGDTGEANGFVLPSGETVFTFKLLAPTEANLEYDVDEETGEPTTQVLPLNISYDFSTLMDDPCIIQSMNELSDILEVLYQAGKTFIIVNQHITTRLK